MATDTVSARRSLFIDSFKRSLRAQNASEATVATYTSAVERLADFLISVGMPTEPAAITREHIESFVNDLLAKWKPATANNRYRGLQQYFNWLIEEGEIQDSPMAKMKPPKIPEKAPPVLSEDDFQRLFKACDGRSFEDRRDTALIRLLLDTGLRRQEIAGITLEDVDLDRQTITVLGKGRRPRTVKFGRKAARDLDRYLRVRGGHAHASAPQVWLGKHGPMTGSGVYQIVVERAHQAGIKAYTHLFRHSFAHYFLDAGGQEHDLMQLAGWRSRTMVGRYGASRAEERSHNAHKSFSPGDRI